MINKINRTTSKENEEPTPQFSPLCVLLIKGHHLSNSTISSICFLGVGSWGNALFSSSLRIFKNDKGVENIMMIIVMI